MYRFPEKLYSDIRIEDVYNTSIAYENFKLKQNKVSREKGAFIRVWDGKRWYYSATTDLNSIQSELDSLAALAQPNDNIAEDSVVKLFEVNRDVCLKYKDNDVRNVSNEKKTELLESYLPVMKENEEISISYGVYYDTHTEKWFYSSLGADLHFDYQRASVVLSYTITAGDIPFSDAENIYRTSFDELNGHHDLFRNRVKESLNYAKNAVPVVPGVYTCILSPKVAGVFAHESFGHKSEADLMLGSETMLKEWAIGTRVGADILSIADTGEDEGSGYVPYDDEGTKSKKTYLIHNGILTGRLHSASTAAIMHEELTGNARAKNFEFEPIVRMTSTFICPGELTLDELFAGVKEGIYIPHFNHGSGMSTFTIAPSVAYMIRDGKVAEPVRISVISGSVMETLYKIDGLTKEGGPVSMSTGGCGKMEQYPLRVAFGGPYVRVNGINVQ